MPEDITPPPSELPHPELNEESETILREQERQHDLRMRAYKLNIPEEEVPDNLDQLETLVKERERFNDLHNRAYRLGIAENELPDDIDVLEQLVLREEQTHQELIETYGKGAPAMSPEVQRHTLLMEAYRWGIPLTEEESKTIGIAELQRRIDEKREKRP